MKTLSLCDRAGVELGIADSTALTNPITGLRHHRNKGDGSYETADEVKRRG